MEFKENDHKYKRAMEHRLEHIHIQQVKKVQGRIRIVTLILTILLVFFLLTGYRKGWFDSTGPLESLFARLGPVGFIVAGILVVLNCIIPVFPASLPSVAMFIAYGPVFGFLSVLILNIIGSAITFSLSDQFGEKFVKAFVPDAVFDQIHSKIKDEKTATTLLITAYLVPGVPDDATTMVVGMTNMSLSRFLTIAILCKPIPTYLYLFGFSSILQWIFHSLLQA